MNKFVIVSTIILAAGVSCALGAGQPSATVAAIPVKVIDLTPEEAFRLLQSNKAARLLDVRTQAEYVFVGHPNEAVNIPLQFWRDDNTWSENRSFDAKVLATFPPETPIITICRSGHRSRVAAERLLTLGYSSVYNMVESFEGDSDPSTGRRTVNGWKNRGLPYTYKIDPALYYKP